MGNSFKKIGTIFIGEDDTIHAIRFRSIDRLHFKYLTGNTRFYSIPRYYYEKYPEIFDTFIHQYIKDGLAFVCKKQIEPYSIDIFASSKFKDYNKHEDSFLAILASEQFIKQLLQQISSTNAERDHYIKTLERNSIQKMTRPTAPEGEY